MRNERDGFVQASQKSAGHGRKAGIHVRFDQPFSTFVVCLLIVSSPAPSMGLDAGRNPHPYHYGCLGTRPCFW
jgi:hypothetical protein